MAKFWKQLAQALPGTVEGFYKGRKMTQDAEQQKLENMYRQQKMLQDAQSIELDRSYKNKQMEKWDAENAPADFSWAAGNKELSGLFPQGTDLTRISRTDPRFSAAQKILERDPLDREYKRSQIAQNEAQTKKTMGEITMSPLEVKKMEGEIELLKSRARNSGQTDPAQARIMNARAAILEQQLQQGKMKSASATPAQKEVDKAFGKEYADYYAGGGRATIDKNLQALEGAAGKLKSGEVSTGGFVGILPDFAADIVAPQRAAVRDDIQSAIQGTLKQVLGAQFTEKEGDRIFSRAFNPRLSNEENAKRAQREIDALKAMARDKEAAAQYFERNGTLVGFVPSRASLYKKESTGGGPLSAAEQAEYEQLKRELGQ